MASQRKWTRNKVIVHREMATQSVKMIGGTIDPSFEPHQCLLAGTWQGAKRSAGVTPEVNLGERLTHTLLPTVNKTANSGFETQRRRHQKTEAAVRYLSHELLGGEDEFVVDKPARSVLEQAAVRMGVHRLLVLHRLVRAAGLREACRVVEEPGRHRLKHGGK